MNKFWGDTQAECKLHPKKLPKIRKHTKIAPKISGKHEKQRKYRVNNEC